MGAQRYLVAQEVTTFVREEGKERESGQETRARSGLYTSYPRDDVTDPRALAFLGASDSEDGEQSVLRQAPL